MPRQKRTLRSRTQEAKIHEPDVEKLMQQFFRQHGVDGKGVIGDLDLLCLAEDLAASGSRNESEDIERATAARFRSLFSSRLKRAGEFATSSSRHVSRAELRGLARGCLDELSLDIALRVRIMK